MTKLTLTGYFQGQQANKEDDYLTVTFDCGKIVTAKDNHIEVEAEGDDFRRFFARLDTPSLGIGSGSISNEQAFHTWRSR